MASPGCWTRAGVETDQVSRRYRTDGVTPQTALLRHVAYGSLGRLSAERKLQPAIARQERLTTSNDARKCVKPQNKRTCKGGRCGDGTHEVACL